jgi:hypothetical protein
VTSIDIYTEKALEVPSKEHIIPNFLFVPIGRKPPN